MKVIVLPGFFIGLFMSLSLANTPSYVKVRIWQNNGWFYVLRRLGDCWESISRKSTKDDALKILEKHYIG